MPQALPEYPFVIRAFTENSDLPKLVHLLAEAEAIDHYGEDISEQTVQEQLSIPLHDPSLDRWVIEHPHHSDQLIGHSAIWQSAPTDSAVSAEMSIVVHPSWRHQGLGTELISRSIARAQILRVTQVLLYAATHDIPTALFLAKHHFEPVAAYTEMHAVTTSVHERPQLPPGYSIRSYVTIQHPPTLIQALNDSFAGLWGHHPVSEEDLLHWLPMLDLDGIFILFAPDGTIAGMCRAERDTQHSRPNDQANGYIDGPGVVVGHRSGGLYRALLLHSAQWLQQQQQKQFKLESWGDTADTIQVYSSLGFTIVRQQLTYKREIEP